MINAYIQQDAMQVQHKHDDQHKADAIKVHGHARPGLVQEASVQEAGVREASVHILLKVHGHARPAWVMWA